MDTDFYLQCDKLENLPAINRENWLFELEFQCNLLPHEASLLQVGSMDATRMIEILKKRRDLKVTGLEIEERFVKLAEQNLKKNGLSAGLIHADITTFQTAQKYDFVTCLNNTLSYIPETQTAIENMRRAGQTVIISVYGEKFDEAAANAYFGTLGAAVENAAPDFFEVENFGRVKRFTRDTVASWDGEIHITPLGYLTTINT